MLIILKLRTIFFQCFGVLSHALQGGFLEILNFSIINILAGLRPILFLTSTNYYSPMSSWNFYYLEIQDFKTIHLVEQGCPTRGRHAARWTVFCGPPYKFVSRVLMFLPCCISVFRLKYVSWFWCDYSCHLSTFKWRFLLLRMCQGLHPGGHRRQFFLFLAELCVLFDELKRYCAIIEDERWAQI